MARLGAKPSFCEQEIESVMSEVIKREFVKERFFIGPLVYNSVKLVAELIINSRCVSMFVIVLGKPKVSKALIPGINS